VLSIYNAGRALYHQSMPRILESFAYRKSRGAGRTSIAQIMFKKGNSHLLRTRHQISHAMRDILDTELIDNSRFLFDSDMAKWNIRLVNNWLEKSLDKREVEDLVKIDDWTLDLLDKVCN